VDQTLAPAEKLPAAGFVERWWLVLLMVAVVAAVMVAVVASDLGDRLAVGSVLHGDPPLYEERWEDMASGAIPYVDMVFEHLPLTIVPIAGAALLRDLLGVDYSTAFTLLTAILVIATTAVVRGTARSLGEPAAGTRFLILIVPLLPLLLFRNDFLPVLCAAIAVSAWVRGRELTGVVGAAAGVLAKAWPVALVVTEWWRGNRARAVMLTIFTAVLMAALLSLPGFQSGRAFAGVHEETIAGSLVLLWRHITGTDLGIVLHAGAWYLKVGAWAAALNLAIGAGLGIWALTGVRADFTWHRAHTMLSALVLALVLASPLLSPQFLVWPMAFLAIVIGRRPLIIATVTSIATIVLFGIWDPQAVWWSISLLGRNALVVALAVIAARAAATGKERIV
jgi:hypothetical protein